MEFLNVNPGYRAFLQKHQLDSPAAILALPAEIVSGHPDRHVAQLMVGRGSDAVAAYLKREHRVAWKVRLSNALAGFGFVSKSYREFQILQELHQAGIRCPECLAAGEDEQGRAFLLLRTLSDTVDLRCFLQQLRTAPPSERRQFARRLGECLAKFHNAGFDHPDLYSKHLHIHPPDQAISFLDCQRTRRWRLVTWKRRCRDLGALQATLADQLATVRERLCCLRAYLRACQQAGNNQLGRVASMARSIHQVADRLLRQRRIQELRRLPLAADQQRLIWQDGESLCLTPQFQAALQGQTPDWLLLAHLPAQPARLELRSMVALPTYRPGQLLRRRKNSIWEWLWAWLRGKPLTSSEVKNAGLLFRLERSGIPVPRLLAFGQRHVLPWQVESFLLTETESESVSLAVWLQDQVHSSEAARRLGQRRHLIREAGRLLRQLHDADCCLAEDVALHAFVVQKPVGKMPRVYLGSIEAVQACRRLGTQQARTDLEMLRKRCAHFCGGRMDRLRFLLAYLRLSRLTPEAKVFARSLRRHLLSTTLRSLLS